MQFTLKELRARKGVTQEDIADKLGITRQAYSKIEQEPGKASCNRVSLIASLLDVTIDDIFLGKYPTNSKVE